MYRHVPSPLRPSVAHGGGIAWRSRAAGGGIAGRRGQVSQAMKRCLPLLLLTFAGASAGLGAAGLATGGTILGQPSTAVVASSLLGIAALAFTLGVFLVVREAIATAGEPAATIQSKAHGR